MNKALPPYLRAKYQLIGTVTFTAFFSLFFILVSIPFSHNIWFELKASGAFILSLAFYLASLGCIIVSKRVMYLTRFSLEMNYLQYFLWNLGEIVLICILYVGFTLWGNREGIIDTSGITTLRLFEGAFIYSFLCVAIPYIIAGMFFAIIDKNKTIRLMNTHDVVTDEVPEPGHDSRKVTLYDNSGVMKLSVSLDNLFYIESDDNYVMVWYTDNSGALKKYMIRCRLKTIEASFQGSSLVRCHRKYIVNLDKVRILRKEKEGYFLELENDSIPPIAVTKTYAFNVLPRFCE